MQDLNKKKRKEAAWMLLQKVENLDFSNFFNQNFS